MREFLNYILDKKYYVMLLISLMYILGVISFFSKMSVEIAFVILIFSVIAILKNYISPKLVLLFYIMFIFGFVNSTLKIKDFDNLYQNSPQNNINLTGQIISIPKSNKPNQVKFLFSTQEPYRGKTFVTVKSGQGNFSEFNIGDFYKIQGKLRQPFRATNPSQFDYANYLKNFHVYTTFYADSKNCFEINKDKNLKWGFLQRLNDLRNDIIKMHSKYLKSPNLEVLGGVVFGDDAVSPPDYIKASFINSGLLHILAASGMNVAIIYGIWFWIMLRLRVPFKFSVASGIFVIVLYSLMTGLGASIIRAAVMLIFILLGKLIDREAHSISLLSFVALLMLIYNPAYINDVGFQLSFIVTFGLLVTMPLFYQKEQKHFLPNWLSGAILVPLVAQIWVAPIQMFYFNTFSAYSLFANISILPFLSVISFGGFISSVLCLIKPIADFICMIFDFVLNPFISAIVFLSDFFSHLPNSLLTTTHPSIVQILIYYLGVILITLSIANKKLLKYGLIVVGILLLTLIPINNNNLEITAFDVKNADCFLIKSPDNKYFIIDSGKSGYDGGASQAKIILFKYLKDKGIKEIETFIITHFDNDHSGGAVDLIQNLKIKNVCINSFEDTSLVSKKIYKILKETHTNTILITDDKTVYKKNDFAVNVYTAGLNGKNIDNENSIITEVSNEKFDALFMGDAGIEAYGKIKNKISDKNIEVLKVGHHGGNNVVNKEMLKNMKSAIISVGFNTYGHPNPITLNTLEKSGVKIYRTDKNGAIKIVSKGNKYKFYTFINKKFVLKSDEMVCE